MMTLGAVLDVQVEDGRRAGPTPVRAEVGQAPSRVHPPTQIRRIRAKEI